jgi:predicted metal-dependent enzyme (double-stranded beta helix superfamily)
MTWSIDPRTEPLSIARSYADNPDEWPLAPRFDLAQRWQHRLAESSHAQVWLVTWLPGQTTEIHDHGGSAGALVIVSGTLTEHVPHHSGPGGATLLRPTVLPAGAGRRLDPQHVHQLGNESDRPTVSVHVYLPALKTVTRYRLDGGRLRVTTVERSQG